MATDTVSSSDQSNGHMELQVTTKLGPAADSNVVSVSAIHSPPTSTSHLSDRSKAESYDKLSDETNRCSSFLSCQAVAFYIIVVCLWVILSLPTVFYFLPIDSLKTETGTLTMPTTNTSKFNNLSLSNCTVTCSEDFFCKEGTNRCVPSCGTFEAQSTAFSTLSIIGNITSSSIGVIGSLVALILCCIKRKLSFPSVFIFYLLVSTLFFNALSLIGSVGQETLFCSSENLLESVNNSTPFCIIFGMIVTYMGIAAAFWWMLHVIFSWWKIQFPFNFRDYEAYHKYIHLGCVLLGLLLPALRPVVTLAVGARDNRRYDTNRYGYSLSTFPPIDCFPYRSDVSFYTQVLPVNIISLIAVPFLLHLFWLIYKHKTIMKRKKKFNKKMNVAQKKLLIIFIYFFAVIFLVSLFSSFSAKSSETISIEINEYFICEANGTNPDAPCDRSQFERLTVPLTIFKVLFTSLLEYLPWVFLVYILDTKDVKKSLKSCL